MRILRVAQKVYPDVKGGGPYHVHAMSRDQAAMGHDVTVLTVGDGPHREERDGYTLIRQRALVEPLGNAIAPGVASYLRRADEFDVVHAHSHLYFSTNLAALARRLGATPLALTNHGLYSQTAPEWMFDGYLRTMGRWTFNQADVVFCYTEAEREGLQDRGVETDIAVVPNGIDTSRFCPDGPFTDEISGDPSVLFVGRLVEGKRPADAVETLAKLQNERPGAELFIVGSGPLESVVRQKADNLDVSDKVTLFGQVPYESMPDVYRTADVLLLPSRSEGLPRTVLEALATNVPVVASDLPQISPIIDGAGRTVDVGDIEGFSNAVDRVIDNEDIQPRSIAADYDWSRTVRWTTDVLASISDRN